MKNALTISAALVLLSACNGNPGYDATGIF